MPDRDPLVGDTRRIPAHAYGGHHEVRAVERPPRVCGGHHPHIAVAPCQVGRNAAEQPQLGLIDVEEHDLVQPRGTSPMPLSTPPSGATPSGAALIQR
nr:hypothetical protein [Nonomuraea sp. FMUSA5-5]